MSIAALIRRMSELGAPSEAIALAVEAIEAEQAKDAERRAKRAEQKAKERERKATVARQSCDMDATVGDTPPPPLVPPLSLPQTPTQTPPYNPPTPTISVGRKRPTPSEFFDRFKAGYPKREGANPWQPALKAFNRAVDAGADPEDIIRGAQIYRSQQSGKDARFVAQAVTWLNQERWNDHTPTPSVAPTGPPPTRLSREEVEAQVRAFGLIK